MDTPHLFIICLHHIHQLIDIWVVLTFLKIVDTPATNIHAQAVRGHIFSSI